MKHIKLDRIADSIAFLGVSIAAVWLIVYWDRLPDDIAFIQNAGDVYFLEKERLIGMFVVFTIGHVGWGVASRFPHRSISK